MTLPVCGEGSNLYNCPVVVGLCGGQTASGTQLCASVLSRRVLAASVRPDCRATPFPAEAAQVSVGHVLKTQALPGPPISVLLLTAESAVSTSLSTVFCLIICESFLE